MSRCPDCGASAHTHLSGCVRATITEPDFGKPLVIVNGEAVADGQIICDGEPMTLNIYSGPPVRPDTPMLRISTED